MKAFFRLLGLFSLVVLLNACTGFDYYSPYYYSDEPHAPVTEPTDDYSYDSNHPTQSAGTSRPSRRSHGAQYNRPSAPQASQNQAGASASTSSSNNGALSKTPRFEENSAPPPPVVE